MRRLLGTCSLLAVATFSARAGAVPIPAKNCGSAGDLLSVQTFDSSVWPPSAAAPFNATATRDSSGLFTNLRVFLLYGPAWTFDTGPLAASVTNGFVSLPATMPVTVTSPSFPILAGPYSITRTFTDRGFSTTIVSKANLAAQLNPPLTTTLSLSFNGTPGFPLEPMIGVYNLQVQMAEAGGAEVFCLDLNMPLKNAVPVGRIAGVRNVPLLPPLGVALLAVLLAGFGLLAVRMRRP